jgi:flavin-dependent dehydrogenase
MSDYDVIIIGGRVAGASLAIHLAQQNLKIFLLDRASFPSSPQVPSAPFIHLSTMRLLDELGIAESAYSHPDGMIKNYAVTFSGYFNALMPLSLMQAERDYSYGIDRRHFDKALWDKAAGMPTVTAQSKTSATAILKENDKVIGILAKDADGNEQRITADRLVGADGRFSWAAREFGAAVLEERNDYMGTSYSAEWEGVAPFSPDEPHTLGMYTTGKGYMVLCIPIDKDKYIVGNYLTKDKINFAPQELEKHYLDGLKTIPELWARLNDARRVTDIVGIKGIQNGYRQPYGDKWSLVGDAVHYKDPLDGQGIYDALLGAKILAQAIQKWKTNAASWEEAMHFYKVELWKATYPMFLSTVKRIKQEIYTYPPPFIVKTLVNWAVHDPDYQAHYLRYQHRLQENLPAIKPSYLWRGFQLTRRKKS